MIPKLHCISLCAPLSFFPILGSVVSTNAHIWSCHSFVILCISFTPNRILVGVCTPPLLLSPGSSTQRFVTSRLALHPCLPSFHLFTIPSPRLAYLHFPYITQQISSRCCFPHSSCNLLAPLVAYPE